MLAMVLGPLLDSWIGVPGIFTLTAVLGVAGALVVLLAVPAPAVGRVHPEAETVPSTLKRVLGNGDLLRLDFGIFSLHLVLTALFLAVPLQLRDAGLVGTSQAWLYGAVLLLSVVVMLPLVVFAERRSQLRPVFLGAVSLLVIAQLLLYLGDWQWLALGAILALFFIGFNLLEASLPSLVSRTVGSEMRGTAMGVYSTSQFAGAFAGGILGGWIQQLQGLGAVFLLGSLVCVVWLVISLGMRFPRRTHAAGS
jgi:MFS family permease